jgi:Hydrolytic ATP binding site of dynein motor region
VLLRALRDFNLGKLTADDTGIFMGLLNDLFPKTVEQVSRAIDHEFEAKVRRLLSESFLFALFSAVIRLLLIATPFHSFLSPHFSPPHIFHLGTPVNLLVWFGNGSMDEWIKSVA